jgi:hypothetical protein
MQRQRNSQFSFAQRMEVDCGIHPLTVTNGSATYHLRLQPASYGIWSPDYFTTFKLTSSMKNLGRIKTVTEVGGVGGALVGVRRVTPPEDFAPKRGISAPVTATLDFHGVTLLWRFAVQQGNRQLALKAQSGHWQRTIPRHYFITSTSTKP